MIYVYSNPIKKIFFSHEYLEIMEMIDKRLNDHGKNWRHVFKVSNEVNRVTL